MVRPTDTPFRDGFKIGRGQKARERCPYRLDSKKAAQWHRAQRMGRLVRVGRNKPNTDPACDRPIDCVAAGDGLCRRCSLRDRHKNDEAYKAKRDAHILEAGKKQRSRDGWRIEHAERASALGKKMAADRAFIKRLRARMKKQWEDPEYRARQTAVSAPPERTAQLQAAMTRLSADPKFAKRRRRANQKSGRWVSETKQDAIVLDIRETSDPYSEIGVRHGVSRRTVNDIALKNGIVRGRNGSPSRARTWTISEPKSDAIPLGEG